MSEGALSAGTVSLTVVPDTKGFGKLLSGALNGEKGNWDMLGKKLGKDVATGLLAAGAAATAFAANFQEATTQLVTGAGESEANIAMVRKGILAMSGAVGTMPQQLAKGMYMIESAGYHGAKGLDVLKAAAMGAKVGGAEMETVANALTTAMTDYNIPASRANAVTSALVATVAAGKMHMQDLGLALGMVMPKASALGVSFQDVNGALATMTGAGMSARRASMNLANTILSLGAPSNKASIALGEIGLSAQQVKDDLSKKGLAGTMQEIEEHVSQTFPKGSVAAVDAFKSIMGGAVGYGTALALTGTHMAAFEANTKSVGAALNGQNASVAGFALTQKDLKFQIDQAKASVAAIGVQIGSFLIPIIEKVVGWFAHHKAATIALAAVIGGVLLAATVAWTVSLFAAGGALAFLMSPVTLIVAGIALLALGVKYAYDHFKIFHEVVDGIWHWLKEAVVGTIHFVKQHWDLIVGVFLGPIGLVAAELIKHWHSIVHSVSAAIGDVVGFFKHMPTRILGALGDLGHLLSDIGSAIFGGLWDGMKSVWKHVTGWLGGIGKKIAHLKGPLEYDRALLIPHGNAIMDGLNEGLVAGFLRVMTNVSGMSAKIAGSLHPSIVADISGRMSENGGPGTPTIVRATTGRMSENGGPGTLVPLAPTTTPGRMSENGGPGSANGSPATSADIATLTKVIADLPKTYLLGQRQGLRMAGDF